MGLLTGKTALVTGAARGIGKAVAMKFASEGANIAFTDLVLNDDMAAGLEATRKEIEALGVTCRAYAGNAADFEETEKTVKQIHADFGSIDILVNNAGVLDTGLAPVDKFDDAETQKVISINQIGTMQCIRAALQYMKEGASIVNVASVAGVNGGGGAAYVSTKSAIIGITKHTALLLADKYIRCNAVCPGTIVTPMTMNMKPEALDMRMMGAMSKHADLKIRPCMADDVANIICFLASDDSKALTGQVMVSDFGASL